MELKLYSVFDKKSLAFMPPFVMPADGVAIRSFSDEVNKSGSSLNQHPEDYSLYYLGFFDDHEGVLVTNEIGPKVLVDALTVLIKQE